MGKMEHLKSLVLDGNPLKSLRRDVVMVRIILLLKFAHTQRREFANSNVKGDHKSQHGARGGGGG